MNLKELIIYSIKKFVDFKFRKRSIFFWLIKYFSIALVVELGKLAADTQIDDFYIIVEEKAGFLAYCVLWLVINIIFGGLTLVFSWLSILIKVAAVFYFSRLEYLRVTSNLVFRPSKKWFNQIYSKYYSADIKLKYVEGLHHTTSVEKKELKFILDFDAYKRCIIEKIIETRVQFESFEKAYKEVQRILRNGEKQIPDYKAYQTLPDLLNNQLLRIRRVLQKIEKRLSQNHYKSINIKIDILDFVEFNWIEFKSRDRNDFENWTQEEQISFTKMIQAHNYVLNKLESLNYYISTLNQNTLYIAGNAGVGKTHLAAHLSKELKSKGDYPIFLKAELFSGSEIRLDAILREILGVPSNYNTSEILHKLNRFARKRNSRVFIILDALNETTNNNIGFSKIWRIHLQNFSNQLLEFSNLFLICTLRTSYINRIWGLIPDNLITIKGYDSFHDREQACQLYFNHYNINVTNIETADLSHFRNPLLLDLYCKLINGSRGEVVNINLNIEGYIAVFEDYIAKLKEEVRVQKNLAALASINTGFDNSSRRFLDNNEALCTTDEFVEDFDPNPNVSEDESIAKAILEGYLIYIKDYIEYNKSEIVQFTQQEIGGFVLAKKLRDDFPNLDDLLASDRFNKQLVGSNPSEQHQLRFDILKFLIALYPEIITKVSVKEVVDLSWWYLYNADQNVISKPILEHIQKSPELYKYIFQLADSSESFWFKEDHPYNFNFILEIFKGLSQWEYDISWNQYIYYEGANFQSLINQYLREIIEVQLNETLLLKTKVIITVLSSNARELRDKATLALLSFGNRYPNEFLILVDSHKDFPDIYIYERLIHCCYGIVMNYQNDLEFIENVLPVYADTLFKYQFGSEPTNPVYNYIVVDSIKHIIDLAVYKEVYSLPDEAASKRVREYKFYPPNAWVGPTMQQQEIINNSSEMSPPDPLRMDFGIYTTPRLIDREEYHTDAAIANIWSRILHLGYTDYDHYEKQYIDKDFFFGESLYRIRGKVDRLGKKYCWIAFFDFAGKLLLDDQLNVWDKGDTSREPHYERLGDVDIDISNPSKKYVLKERLFSPHLLKEKNEGNKKWNFINKIDLCTSLFEHEFDGANYKMLYGFIEQRQDEYHETRSFLMINTLLIDRDQLGNLESLNGKLYSWKHDVHISPSYLYRVYFGELYWADTIPDSKQYEEWVPNGEFTGVEKTLSKTDLYEPEYAQNKVGDKVIYNRPDKIMVNSEPTLINYIWETNSETFKHFSEYIPSDKIGKYLNLKPNCETGKILDSDLNEAFKCIEYEDDKHFSNNFNYLRSDLLQHYMDENNLALLYQVKQHSYSPDSPHYRKLKYFIR